METPQLKTVIKHMGRYYHGEIEGKFWFAVQSSLAPQRFGGVMHEPDYVTFSFDKERDLDTINAEIKKIQENLGHMKQKIDDFFSKNIGYNDQMLSDAGIDAKYLSDYADLQLGIKIRDCVIENDGCTFDAEL